MTGNLEHLRLLILVKTYPHPSKSHDEIVCTAGTTEAGEWIRLYPVDYRYLDDSIQFHKYQWIELDVFPRGHRNDARKESRKPRLDTIRLSGSPISTKDGWRHRREIVDRLPHRTLNELMQLYDDERVSLGVVRPKRVVDLTIRPVEGQWPDKYQQLVGQLRLFGSVLPLRKIPFEFRYVFECEDDERPREALITDWELGALFLEEEKRLGSPERAAESVKKEFLDTLCGEDKDTRFFMGTTHPFNTWIVIGVFYPPRGPDTQQMLF